MTTEMTDKGSTYCVLSVLQIRNAQLLLLLLFLNQVLRIVLFAIGPKYFELYYSNEDSSFTSNTVLNLIDNIIAFVSYFIYILITLLQIYEWKVMTFIIENENQRNVSEIFRDTYVNHSPLSNTSAQRGEFKKKELRLRLIFIGVLLFIIFGHLSLYIVMYFMQMHSFLGYNVLAEILILLLALTYYLRKVSYLMREYHNYHYEQIKRSLFTTYVLIALPGFFLLAIWIARLCKT